MAGRMALTIGGETRRVRLFRAYARLAEIDRFTEGKPALEHLPAVAGLLADLGFPGVSLLTAARFHKAVGDVIAELRGRNWGLSEARLAKTYGAGVFGARPTDADRLKMAINEDRLWAEDQLRNTPGLSPERLKQLTLLATGSIDAAEDAWSKAVLREMREGLTPAR